MTDKHAYTRNIMMIDATSGDRLGVTSVATLGQDLVFLTGANYTGHDITRENCLRLEAAYINGDERGDLEEYVGIRLHRIA